MKAICTRCHKDFDDKSTFKLCPHCREQRRNLYYRAEGSSSVGLITKKEHETLMKDSNGWEALANAIIVQACNDYRREYKLTKTCPAHSTAAKEARRAMLSIEMFFRSRWFMCLTELNGERLIRELRKEVDTKYDKKRKGVSESGENT